jgi:hypothetical protein
MLFLVFDGRLFAAGMLGFKIHFSVSFAPHRGWAK